MARHGAGMICRLVPFELSTRGPLAAAAWVPENPLAAIWVPALQELDKYERLAALLDNRPIGATSSASAIRGTTAPGGGALRSMGSLAAERSGSGSGALRAAGGKLAGGLSLAGGSSASSIRAAVAAANKPAFR